MKARVIAVVNQKGGVGKSTTALALAAGLTLKGYKVLAVDLDAQANLSYSSAAKEGGATILGVLTGEVKAAAAVQHTKNGDIIAASQSLAGAEAFITETGREYKLQKGLKDLVGQYDFVIIDTPPALGILTVNALTAANSVVIPGQADIYSLQGIEQLVETLKPVKEYCNSGLTIDGILLTRYNPRNVLSKEVAELAEQLARKVGTKVFKTKIREAIAVKEAQLTKQSLFDYAPKANVTADYKAFIKELLAGCNKTIHP